MAVALTVILAAAAGAFALIARAWQVEHRWRRDRERIAANDERMAAHNGRPHTDAVLLGATRRDPDGRSRS